MSWSLFDRVLNHIEKGKGWDEELMLEIVNFQLRHNSFYRSYCDKLGIRYFRNLKELVFLPVEFFKKFEVFSCDNPIGFFLSSGTTGNRSKVYFNNDSLKLYRVSALRAFPFKGKRIFSLVPPFEKAPTSSLSFMIKVFSEEMEVIYLNESLQEVDYMRVKEELNRIRNGDVLFLTSIQLLKLVEAMEEPFEEEIVIIETGGYKATGRVYSRAELVSLASKKFPAAKFHSEYGMAEMFSQFYSDEKGFYHIHPAVAVFTEGRGLLRVFDFANLCTVSALLVPDRIYRERNAFLLEGRITSEIRGCGYVFR